MRAMGLARTASPADGSYLDRYRRRLGIHTTMAVGIAGAFGALARYGVEGLISRRGGAFPWGTFVVNISGAASCSDFCSLFWQSG
jgi:hypothetical protein